MMSPLCANPACGNQLKGNELFLCNECRKKSASANPPLARFMKGRKNAKYPRSSESYGDPRQGDFSR